MCCTKVCGRKDYLGIGVHFVRLEQKTIYGNGTADSAITLTGYLGWATLGVQRDATGEVGNKAGAGRHYYCQEIEMYPWYSDLLVVYVFYLADVLREKKKCKIEGQEFGPTGDQNGIWLEVSNQKRERTTM